MAGSCNVLGSLLSNKSDDDQEKYGTDNRVDDGREDAPEENEPNQRQKPTGNNCADNADNDVASQSEAMTLDDQACEPTGDCADQ